MVNVDETVRMLNENISSATSDEEIVAVWDSISKLDADKETRLQVTLGVHKIHKDTIANAIVSMMKSKGITI